jgi:hypothetical protein
VEKVEYLPLGSVVVIRGAVRKTLIIGRALAVNLDDKVSVFDYAGCVYPEGLVGDQVGYFNHKDIVKVVFEGLNDDDNAMMIDGINVWLESTSFERGNPVEINQSASSSEQDG